MILIYLNIIYLVIPSLLIIIKRGVAIYVHLSLSAQLFNTLSNSGFLESVWCQLNTLNKVKVLLECIHKIPNTTERNDKVLFSLFGMCQ